ncbi:MAG: hypothetical protein F4114_01440 [Rhodospirillaceae bacterium]|nr:hypothetical protein [Rhodospirillaceae bacterium]MYB14735.1 hypothetical protein [Rhodospirillaceae bacterium]MYI47733.1 hypothetical protein [Rhodospirillaceae bacterium]
MKTARCLAACVVAALAIGLAGCGFQPLYADRPGGKKGGESGGGDVAGDVATVRIAPIADRIGQILRNELLDRLNPSGEPADPRYALEVRLAVSRRELGIRRDETATRANLRFLSSFRLREADSGAIVYSGRTASVTSYNIVESEYATISAERAARRRGAILVADGIALRLAAYFNRLRKLRRDL